MKATALGRSAPGRPRPKASLRAWKAWKPTAGSTPSFRIAFGSLAATSSMSMPPCDGGHEHGPAAGAVQRRSPGTSRASPARSIPCSISSRRTTRPSGPVWWVFRVMPEHGLARSLALVRGLRQLDPAALAAAAGVDLGLHHHREAQLLGHLHGLVGGVGHLALGAPAPRRRPGPPCPGTRGSSWTPTSSGCRAARPRRPGWRRAGSWAAAPIAVGDLRRADELRLPPTFMSCTPSVQQGMTPCRAKSTGWPRL